MRIFIFTVTILISLSPNTQLFANSVSKRDVDCGKREYDLGHEKSKCKTSKAFAYVNDSCKYFTFSKHNGAICHELSMNLTDLNLSSLIEFSSSAEEDKSTRRMRIFFPKNTEALNASLLVDSFITPRPWWNVKEEAIRDTYISFILLEKCREDWEQYFKIVIAINFPPEHQCKNAPLLVGRGSCVHPGWFSAIAYYVINHAHHPYAITHTYHREEYGLNAWINGSTLCPHTNLWHCAFLPTTNCSEPEILRNCSKYKCIENNLANSVLFSNADYSGEVVPKDSLHNYGKKPFNGIKWPEPNPMTLELKSYEKRMDMRNGSTDLLFDDISGESIGLALKYSFILRMSAYYRLAVATRLSAFRTANNLSEDTHNLMAPCVAAHIRRGDRMIKEDNVNFTEYCYNLTHHLPCLGKRCNPDSGCGTYSVPFSAITLSHVADKVERLVGPDVRNIYIASDDHQWVTDQIALMKVISILFEIPRIFFLIILLSLLSLLSM